MMTSLLQDERFWVLLAALGGFLASQVWPFIQQQVRRRTDLAEEYRRRTIEEDRHKAFFAVIGQFNQAITGLDKTLALFGQQFEVSEQDREARARELERHIERLTESIVRLTESMARIELTNGQIVRTQDVLVQHVGQIEQRERTYER